MLDVLLLVLRALAAGGASAVEAALAQVSFSQWVAIAIELAQAEPQLKKAYAAIHPALASLIADLENNLDAHDAAGNINAWFRANAPATIPGYADDGATVPIHNPDTSGVRP